MPQPAPRGPRHGGDSPPGQVPAPSWPTRSPEYQPAQYQPGQYQPQGQYPQAPPQYRPEQYQPAPYQHQAEGFRNPRTGSDYRSGDDYTMPVPPGPPGGPPDGYMLPEDHGLPGDHGLHGDDGAVWGQEGARRRGRKRGRVRRVLRLKTVRFILAVLLVFFAWVAFSLGQALTANNGLPLSAKLAEWARDHYLGSVVTMMEQLTYKPPKVGGKPSISLSDPQGKYRFKHTHGFKPDIPKNLVPFASPPDSGEGAWRLAETVHGQPAVFTTLLRVDAVHTSYVAGIASFDQRLVKFQLRPGSTDPGSGFGGAQPWIVPGTRSGLLATFNGGFRLNSSRGGFYLNGSTSGTLTSGAASVVYYRNGTIKIGEWGRDVSMTPDVAGVRQNLKLILDHGQIAKDIDQNVMASFGATLGGAYYVWRSGIGQTKDGRIIYVYGPELSAHTLADLLQRAGAVTAMELDINPEWTTFESYKADGHPSDPTPVAMLPNQQAPAHRYYSVWARDFTAVYAR